MSEWGGYGELAGYGVAFGWDTDEGLTSKGLGFKLQVQRLI